MINKISLAALAAALCSIVACRPEWLLENEFLVGFINHEILALLVVILTITLASVANIQLSINRLIATSFEKDEAAKALCNEIKSELKDNTVIIFLSFFVALVALFVKGLIPNDSTAEASINALILWVLVLNLLTIMDIYNVIYGLSDVQAKIAKDDKGPNPDYMEEAPPTVIPSGKGEENAKP